jgi:ligand-binding sensor domain-containing protein
MKRFLLILFLFVIKTSCGQQLEESFFVPLSGLPTKVVYCIMQDSKGYIWIGTDAGVARYDGNEFFLLTMADGLSDNEVFQIKEDRKGRLWFLTYNGHISIYDKGKILNEKNTDFLASIEPGGISRSWVEKGDSIWYIDYRKAFLFVNDQLKQTISAASLFGHEDAVFSDLSYQSDEFVLLGNTGYYYPASKVKIDYPVGLLRLPLKKSVLFKEQVIYFDGSLVFVYSLLTRKFRSYQLPSKEVILTFTVRDNSGSILVVSDKQLYTLNIVTGEWDLELTTHIPYLGYLLKDKDGLLWAGSQNHGLFLYRPSAVHRYVHATELGTAAVHSLGQWKGQVYAGLINGEFFHWSSGVVNWKKTGRAQGLHKVYGFYELNDQLWAVAGTEFINLQTRQSIPSYGSAKAMAIHGQDLYLGLSYSVHKRVLKDWWKDKVNVYIRQQMVYDKRASSLWLSGDSLFMGTADGLRLLVKDTLVSLSHYQSPLTEAKISRITGNKHGQLFFSTNGKGVGILYKQRCYEITASNGLASNNCNSLVSVGDSVLWVATDKGVSRVQLQWTAGGLHHTVQNISVNEGLPDPMINDITVLSDTIWVATQTGVAWFRASAITKQKPPAILLQQIFVNGEARPYHKSLSLTHLENNLRIDFTSLNFGLAEEPVYSYRLLGADTGWTTIASRRIQFSNLAPGHYRLQITTARPDEQKPDSLLELELTIALPFWKRKVVLVLSFLALALFAGLLFYLRMRAVRKKHLHQQQLLRWEKEKLQLEQKAAALQMNPHFIFNAMNAIRGYYSSGDMEGGHHYISRFSGLMRKMLESNARTIISLAEEIEMLQHYLELISLNHPGKLSWAINNNTGSSARSIGLAPMLIQPFVENAVVHGIGPLEVPGKIEITFTSTAGMLHCIITDNGVGLQQSARQHKYILRTSKGIAITRQRLHMLGPENKLLITEITTEAGQVAGTKVEIAIPITSKFSNVDEDANH